jgi:hypothetical protein
MSLQTWRTQLVNNLPNGFSSNLKGQDYQDSSLSKLTKPAPLPVSIPKEVQEQVASLLQQAMQLLRGELLNSEGMRDTPERVARHWMKVTQGLY